LNIALGAAFEANPAAADRAADRLGLERKRFRGRRPFCAAV
jgi:hypothetical protein